jgi:SAM-dependent methyltransferase
MTTRIGAAHRRLVSGRRAKVLARHLAEMLPPGTVLDIGCGDGTIGALIGERRPDVSITGVDILVRPATWIPVTPFNGSELPFRDKSFDAALLVDVLHHTADPAVLLREAARVSRRAVVIKDHSADRPASHAILRFMDWVGNAHHGVVLTYNFLSSAEWRRTFSNLGMPISQWRAEGIGLYPFPFNLAFETGLHMICRIEPPHTASR